MGWKAPVGVGSGAGSVLLLFHILSTTKKSFSNKMGVTTSKQKVESFNENLVENLSTTTQSISQSSNAAVGTTQGFEISNLKACGGDINVSDISQNVIAEFNFSQMATTTAEADYQTAMKNALESLVEKDTTVKNELGGIGVTNDEQYNTNVQKNINKIVSSVTQSALSSIASTMTTNQSAKLLNFETVCGPGTFNTGGNININNISQNVQLDFVTDQVAALGTKVYSTIVAENDAAIAAGQTLYVENTGFATLLSAWFSGITGIIVTIIIVFVLLIAVIVIPVVLLKRKRKRTAAQAQQAQVSARAAAPAAPAPSVQEVANNPQVQQGVKKATGFIQEVAKNPQVQQGFKKATGFIGNLFKK